MGMASWISSFLKLSSYVRPYLESSKTLSWYPELSARPPLWLLALFIAPASNRWPCAPPPHHPSPAYTVSPTFLAAPLARCYTPLSLASGVSKPLCMSVLKGGSDHQTCSSLASGERQQTAPNSPCFTPTFIRDNVPIFVLGFFWFFPTTSNQLRL